MGVSSLGVEPEVRKLQRLGSGQGRGSRLEAPGLWGWKAVWAECLGLPDWVVGNCRAHDGGNSGAGRQELADGVDADVRDVKEGKVNAVRVVWGGEGEVVTEGYAIVVGAAA